MRAETAAKAAKWWADHLRNGAKLDNGDTSQAAVAVTSLAYRKQCIDMATRSADSANRLEAALKDALLRIDEDYITIGCDYGPDRFLSAVAESVGVRLGSTSLPWKTKMWIDGDTVRVKCGYGASEVTL